MFFMMLSTIEDEQERLKIADIYEKHRHRCLLVALKILKNQQLAEDAIQDAFIEVIKHKEKIFSLSCSDMLPYIVTIVKTRALNIVKKNKKFSDIPFEELDEIKDSGEVPVDEQVINKQDFENLIAHIASLDENYKVALEMKYRDNMSNIEIANVLNITQKNVEMRLYRAKIKLRKKLESEVKTNVYNK
ncbi:MAG: sigma-70 family RNA polymerase sigma factor [Oscillospiraceae bacterium]|nr:sigma-70 family RNA polymerase sigma factor [Oscillospiraceae bacterium]